MSNSNDSTVESYVRYENGMWAVYLEVTFWEPGQTGVREVYRHYIRSFRTERLAEIAADWYKRAAERGPNLPPDAGSLGDGNNYFSY
jgi:hypothetical protein